MNIRAIADKIGMDYDAALEDFCGDVSAISARLLSFPEENSLDALEVAVKEGNAEESRKAARSIRKGAEKIGLTRLAEACSRVEKSEGKELEDSFKDLRTLYISITSVLEGGE